MPIIATDDFRYSYLVKEELWPEQAFCRIAATVNESAAKTIPLGSVVGLVTATGKYKVSVQTATDGSQNAVGLVVKKTDVGAGTDTKVLVMHRGPSVVSKAAIVFDASFDTDAKKAAVYAALEAKNIQVNDAV